MNCPYCNKELPKPGLVGICPNCNCYLMPEKYGKDSNMKGKKSARDDL